VAYSLFNRHFVTEYHCNAMPGLAGVDKALNADYKEYKSFLYFNHEKKSPSFWISRGFKVAFKQ